MADQKPNHLAEKRQRMNLPAAKLPSAPTPTDFRSSFNWRMFRIMAEFVDGWDFLANYKKTVSIFGSARFEPGYKWYEVAREFGALLAHEGYAIVTGGGPGIMQAGNQGAFEAGGESIGLNIQLPMEQRINPFVSKGIGFHYFFVRKAMLSFSARAYVYFPGGFGTLDEFFELVTLIQTKKVSISIPVILMGKEFWEPLDQWFRSGMLEKFNSIDEKDMQIYKIVDTAEEAMAIVRTAPERTDAYY
ncbi:MAG: TIGR00730 family Rossman fold protein [Patescibacteria group bacterium]